MEDRRADMSLMPPNYILKPGADKIVILKDSAPEQKGSIIIPETARAREKILTGRVVAIGTNINSIDPGSYVMFAQYAGAELVGLGEEDGISYQIMQEKDIFCTLVDREPNA